MRKGNDKATPYRYTDNRSEKKCRICMEPILLSATKCRFCGSYQNWRRYLQSSQVVLALLVALVSVVSLSVPIIKNAMTPDDSDLSLTYLDRADITVPIIASNKGSRPAVLNPSAILSLTITNRDGMPQQHRFFFGSMNSSRESLLIPENSSRQYFFYLMPAQPIEGAFERLAADFDNLLSLKRCSFSVSHLTFRGREQREELLIFDVKNAKNHLSAEMSSDIDLQRTLGALECVAKIPLSLREQYKILKKK